MRARFDKANADGELGKRKLTLEVVDDVGDAARNLTAAQELVEQNEVYGVLAFSSAMAACMAIARNEGQAPVARIGLCVGVTLLCWVLFGALILGLAAMQPAR